MNLAPAPLLTITAVERDTRISKDTLRVWERRYGFPTPTRDPHGERLYDLEQVEQLRHIKRLLDAGWRPGRVVGMSLDELQSLALALSQPSPLTTALSAEPKALYTLLRQHDVPALRRALLQTLRRKGLPHLVLEVIPPLLQEIGQAWARGELEVFEEHLCSEAIATVLRAAIASTPAPADHTHLRPRLLMTTVSPEQHGLGLLMAEALCSDDHCNCLSLGLQTPLSDIVKATQAFDADVVALSFSAASQASVALEHVQALRRLLPDPVTLWVGTPPSWAIKRELPNTVMVADLHQLPTLIEQWRAEHPHPSSLSPLPLLPTGLP